MELVNAWSGLMAYDIPIFHITILYDYIIINMATEFITKIYTDIQESQQGYQVQISIHLAKI